MDYEKLIKAVNLCGSTPKVEQCKKCAYWAGGDMSKCIPRMTTDAATALATFQAENEKLQTLSNLGNMRAQDYRIMRDRAVKAENENEKLRAELEQVTQERDAVKSPEVLEAVDELMEFARARMSTGNWLYYVEVLGEWRGQKED